MRVCIVTRGDLLPAHHGAAVKIVRTAEHLARQSGQPCFLVTDDRDHAWRTDGDGLVAVPYPPRVRAAEEWPPIPAMGRGAERLLARLGYPTEELFLYRALLDPAFWGRALWVGLAHDIDVFQAEFPGYGLAAALAARALSLRRGKKVQSAVVQHNVEWDRLAEFGHDVRFIRPIEQAVLRLVDHVIAVSRDDQQRMAQAGLPAHHQSVIPHGVDLLPFRLGQPMGVRDRYGLDPAAPLLIFHGTLHYWPNTEAVRFIAEQLLPRLVPRWPALRVLICGMSPPRYYAHPAIVFTGPVDDLAAHIAAADLALCPVMAGGGTRMKLLEYMAAGKAIVSTAKGAEGIPYTGGVNIEIADGADAFAASVSSLLADPARRSALGEGAARFAQAYDWSRVARAYLHLYGGAPRGQDWSPQLPSLAPLVPMVDGHLPPRRPSKPLTLLLLVNRGCNLRCSFCDLWEDHVHMPIDRALALLDEAVAIGVKTLVLTGGEPFLHPGLFTLVRAAKDRGLGVNITTNGTRIEARWDELVSSGVDSLSFSLDGLAETHDRLRGQPGAWRRTLRGLDAVRAWGGAATSVYFTANRENIGVLVAVADLARDRGAAFDFWPVNDAPDLAFRGPDDDAAWLGAVATLAARDRGVAEKSAYYAEALPYHRGERSRFRCLGFVDQLGVKYTGDLIPCCVWGGEGLTVGNVFETPLRQLWWSPKVQQFRERLYHQGCAAGCFNHSLYELEQSLGESFRVG